MSNKLLLIGGLLPLITTGCTPESTTEERPNVILILVDDLGKEWIEQYGAEGIKLPHLQELAQSSIIFNRAYSMPQSTPSRVAILTGQYPHNNGWTNHYDVPRWENGAHYDINNNPSFARQVRDNGYRTCVAGKWQLNDFRLQPEAMVDVGFDEYCMWTGGESGNLELSESRYWDPYVHTKEGSRQYPGVFGPDLYSDFIVDFIEENHDEPMFIYYPMTLTHTPFVHTPHKMDAKTNHDKHVAMTEYMDMIVGKVMQSLEDNGIADKTYVIFTTDNGTAGNCVGLRNGEYIQGGKTLLSENGINCPFFVRVPAKESRTSDALIDFTDISATILDITGSKVDDKYSYDGVSFVSVLEGAEQSQKGYALSAGGHPAKIGDNGRVQNQFDFRDRAIMGESYKIYLTREREIERVYDIESDPFEKVNLMGEPAVMSQVERELGEIIRNLPEKDANPIYDILEHNTANDVYLEPTTNTRPNFNPTTTKESYEKFTNK